MKKLLSLALALSFCLVMFAACGNAEQGTDAPTSETQSTAQTGEATEETGAADLKVGMIVSAITVDDKSFNQATWEGITRAEEEFGIEVRYLIPSDQSTAGYMQEIANLYDAGYRMIVTPGFVFSQAIFDAQEMYPDCNFVILDAAPQNEGDDAPFIAPNTVSIDYAAQESGFVAGFASALQLQEGEFGALFGVQIPPTELFKTGFQQGVIYANENFDTNIKMNEDNFVWSGSFSDAALGQQISAQLYNSGVNLVYAACGTTALGGFNEAKARAEGGEEVWIIGCDVDQYEDGLLADGSSVTMTSTMKNLSNSTYDMISAAINGTFEGGQAILFDAKNGGTGLPTENPNLSAEVQAEADKIMEMIKNGEIEISTDPTDVSAYN